MWTKHIIKLLFILQIMKAYNPMPQKLIKAILCNYMLLVNCSLLLYLRFLAILIHKRKIDNSFSLSTRPNSYFPAFICGFICWNLTFRNFRQVRPLIEKIGLSHLYTSASASHQFNPYLRLAVILPFSVDSPPRRENGSPRFGGLHLLGEQVETPPLPPGLGNRQISADKHM